MTKTIPQFSPKDGYLAYQTQIDAAIKGVLASGWYILGEQVKGFEEDVSKYLGGGFSLGVANGTDSLEICMRGLGIGKDDRVVTVSHTAVATVSAIERCGAIPIFVDIDPVTYTMAPQSLSDMLDDLKRRQIDSYRSIKAIIPVHIYGHPCDMRSLLDLAKQHSLKVIEDCAQAMGAQYQGKLVGTLADCSSFSFYPTKNLGAFGDGGMVWAPKQSLKEQFSYIRQYGWVERYVSDLCGINSRLDEMQAAILRVLLPHLDENNERRREIARRYTEALKHSQSQSPVEHSGCKHVYHQYVIRTKNRDKVAQNLKEQGIMTAIHYPVPVHEQPAYKNRLHLPPGGLPQTEKAAREILSLPMSAHLSDGDVSRIAEALKEI